MSTNHTPGPWHVQFDTTAETLSIEGDPQHIPNYRGNDKYTPLIAIARDGSFDANPAMLRANARLIAAAPELLAALQGTLAMLKLLNAPGTNDPIEARVFQARAAIAKATGEEQH